MTICIAAPENVAQAILELIEVNFLKIEIFQHSAELLKKIREGKQWLMAYVDENLPDMPGRSLVSLLQYEFPAMPIVLLNGFNKAEMLRELDKVLKHYEQNPPQPTPQCRLKNFVFNSRKQLVYKKGQVIKLRKKEAELLEYFLTFKDKLLSKKALLEAVWGHQYVHSSHTVNTHVNQLRRKLGSDVVQIRNVPRQGFLFTQTI